MPRPELRVDDDYLAAFETWQEARDDVAAFLGQLSDEERRAVMGNRARYSIRRYSERDWRVYDRPVDGSRS